MLTYLDFILVGVMFLSALLAMMRGFTREFFSIVAWASAAVGAVYAFREFQPWARAQIQPNTVADIALLGGSFLIILAVVSFITMRISDLILDSRVGAIDRSLGFVFGLGRGLLLVVVMFLFFTYFVQDERQQPSWVKDARFKPLLETTGERLVALLPEDPETAILDRFRGEGEGEAGTVPAPDEGGEGAAEEGGRRSERQNLDQLLENTRGQRR